ncbi:unnamed protein product [Oncorhynchus mykiss]|uniref:Amidohydrolase-related domain-containing protein n=1 Tax=Oncorhynchus mykiss TaxID=8022 RepID=A0A060X359_ONCMY|nr:unnamed protein product [Oncorhynchus mykiss]
MGMCFEDNHVFICIYIALRKYSAPLNFVTFCHISGFSIFFPLNLILCSATFCCDYSCKLCSGMLDARRVLNHKVKLGLGTDVAGGYSPSMLDAVRRTLDTSKALTIQDPQYQTLTFEEVFRLATLGGSQALSLDEHTGNFQVGKDFDALRVNTAIAGGPIDLINHGEGPKVLLEKFLNLGDDRNIAEVYVAGKRVVPFVETT